MTNDPLKGKPLVEICRYLNNLYTDRQAQWGANKQDYWNNPEHPCLWNCPHWLNESCGLGIEIRYQLQTGNVRDVWNIGIGRNMTCRLIACVEKSREEWYG
jgi:hypothetical protein